MKKSASIAVALLMATRGVEIYRDAVSAAPRAEMARLASMIP
jgi:hypothetical protein